MGREIWQEGSELCPRFPEHLRGTPSARHMRGYLFEEITGEGLSRSTPGAEAVFLTLALVLAPAASTSEWMGEAQSPSVLRCDGPRHSHGLFPSLSAEGDQGQVEVQPSYEVRGKSIHHPHTSFSYYLLQDPGARCLLRK